MNASEVSHALESRQMLAKICSFKGSPDLLGTHGVNAAIVHFENEGDRRPIAFYFEGPHFTLKDRISRIPAKNL